MSERLTQLIGIVEVNTRIERERLRNSATSFWKMVNFLSDGERFDNPEVNKLMNLFSQLALEKLVGLYIDMRGEQSHIDFSYAGDGINEAVKVTIPRDFTVLAIKDPVAQLTQIVACASAVRDFWTGRLKEAQLTGMLGGCEARASAFQSEVRLTIGEDTGTRGIRDLPASLWYESPEPKPIGKDAPDLLNEKEGVGGSAIKLPYDPEELLP